MPTETPWGQQAVVYHAREDRRMLDRLPIQAGVTGPNELRVTPVSGLTLSVDAGDAWVAGSHSGVVRQGLYPVGAPTAEQVVVGTAHASLPRIDQVVLRVRDTVPAPAASGDAENTGKLEVVAGTATSGATLDNRTGAAALPASSLRLADILVPAGFTGPFVQNTHIRDRRPFAHGAFFSVARTGGDYSTTSGSLVVVDATNLQPRIECSGVPVRMTLWVSNIHSVASGRTLVRPAIDGAVQHGNFAITGHPTASTDDGEMIVFDMFPAAGSHLFAPHFSTASGGTSTLRAQANLPFVMTIEEILRQSGSNTGA
jgi:hypothetical protein